MRLGRPPYRRSGTLWVLWGRLIVLYSEENTDTVYGSNILRKIRFTQHTGILVLLPALGGTISSVAGAKLPIAVLTILHATILTNSSYLDDSVK